MRFNRGKFLEVIKVNSNRETNYLEIVVKKLLQYNKVKFESNNY